jgi:hypothetical protein
MTFRSTLRATAGALLAAIASAAIAQALPPETLPLTAESRVSRWQPEVDRLDEAYRGRMLTANDPRANWIAGQLDRGDIEAQIRHFAAARVAAPDNKLYLATLATTCLEPVQPRPDECDAIDRLADWAIRDADNGWPSLLLADRARQRKNPQAMLAYLEQAAGQARFVEYWEAGSLEMRDAVRAMPVAGDDAAKLELAVMYAMPRALIWPQAARATCMGAAERPDAVRNACTQLGAAMRERGSTWMARLIGARMVEANVGSAQAKAMAVSSLASIRGQVAACARATATMLDGLESTDAAMRAKAIEEWDRWLKQEALVGEARACEIRVAAMLAK